MTPWVAGRGSSRGSWRSASSRLLWCSLVSTRPRSGWSEPAAATGSPAPRRPTGSTLGVATTGSTAAGVATGSREPRGKDRIKGAKGKDRLLAGKGADRLKAVDDKKDRAVNGGAGKDVCTIDQADLAVLKNCEKAKVRNGPGAAGRRPEGDEARAASPAAARFPPASSRSMARSAEATTGTVSGGGGVGTRGGRGGVHQRGRLDGPGTLWLLGERLPRR